LLNVFKHQKSFSLFKNIPHIPMCGGSERFVCACVCVSERRLAKIHYILSELVLAEDKVLIVGDFNIHVDNKKDALGLEF